MWDTLDNIIRGAQEGPRSCMQWDNDSVDERGGHPYEVYEPEYGWRMAVRLQGSRVMGRCLVNIDPHDESNKTFVRSYKRDENEGYSHSDEGLEAWLRAAGYTKTSGWEGCSIAYKTPTPRYGDREPLLPYLDGDAQNVSVRTSASGKQYFRIVDCGEEYDYESNNTNGRGDPAQRYTCACCGFDFNSLDDSLNAGYYGDDLIGECCSNEFIEVRGRNGSEYYIHMDNAVEVNGDYYHDQYLDDNNIVELNNGDYALADEAVEINGEWYAQDDDRIVTLVDTGDAALCDEDCWQCNESGDWYSTCIDPVEIDGNTYHPDSEAAQAHAAESNETEE